jgi:hypothetical protein
MWFILTIRIGDPIQLIQSLPGRHHRCPGLPGGNERWDTYGEDYAGGRERHGSVTWAAS